MPKPTAPRVIVAVTGEDDRYRSVRRRARDLAVRNDGIVILYDIDAGGLFASPTPTDVSAEGEAELFEETAVDERLEPEALERVGRTAIAAQVRAMRAQGVGAWGWLPASRDGADLGAYAERVGAQRVLLPPGLEQPTILERLAAHHGTGDAAGQTSIPFEVVDAEPTDRGAEGQPPGQGPGG